MSGHRHKSSSLPVVAYKSQSRCPHHPIDLDHLSTKSSDGSSFLDEFDHIILDCDGVCYIDDKAVKGSAETVNALQRMGKTVLFGTNSSIKSRTGMASKLKKLGFNNLTMDQLFPSSYAAAVYLKSVSFKGKAFVVGMSGIVDELNNTGIKTITDTDPNPSPQSAPKIHVQLEDSVAAVVVGYDNQFTLTKLCKACSYLKQKDCLLIVCNNDDEYPSSDTRIVNPGPGKLVSAITCSSDKTLQPILVAKPTTTYFSLMRKVHPNMDPNRTLMVGDRLTTDILFARNNGIRSLFVQTGLSHLDDMRKFADSPDSNDWNFVPDFYSKSLASLMRFTK
jgi:phosphoglycolate phosphatase